mgnify:CR=1 FL=1
MVDSYFDGFQRVIEESKYQDKVWLDKWTRYMSKVKEESFKSELPTDEARKKSHIFKGMLRLKILQWSMSRIDLENNFDLNSLKLIAS